MLIKMRGKKGILFTLLLFLLFFLLIVAGILYIKIRLSGLEFKTGKVIVKLEYEKENEEVNKDKIKEPISNSTNLKVNNSDNNLTYINITSD